MHCRCHICGDNPTQIVPWEKLPATHSTIEQWLHETHAKNIALIAHAEAEVLHANVAETDLSASAQALQALKPCCQQAVFQIDNGAVANECIAHLQLEMYALGKLMPSVFDHVASGKTYKSFTAGNAPEAPQSAGIEPDSTLL